MTNNEWFISTRNIELYYGDTDMMGVVYHANYLKFFERGRTGLIEDLGFSYIDMENKGYVSPVYDIYAKYIKPLRYGDKATVHTWVEKNDGIRTVYGYHITNGQKELCVEGTSTHLIVDKQHFKPKSFKKQFPEWFAKYEEIKKMNNQ